MKRLGADNTKKQLPPQFRRYRELPIIVLSVAVGVLPYIFLLLQIPEVYIVGILFMIINSIISYQVGKLVKKRRVSRLWLIILPLVFCLAVWIGFPLYVLLFGLVYLIFELFALMSNEMYN